MKENILVIDDEVNILKLIKMNLERNQFTVTTGENGNEALDLSQKTKPDLIILDLMLPDMDGIEVCKRLRMNDETMTIPIVMLTAKAEETDKIIGLEMGADYYLTKPFSVRELVAVVRAVLRRTSKGVTETRATDEYDLLSIDRDNFKVFKSGIDLSLTFMEYKLLTFLLDNRNKVLNRQLLIEELTDKENKPDRRSIDVHIWNIRKKLDSVKPEREYIETIRGIGYKFNIS